MQVPATSASVAESLRDSGIAQIGALPWGSHVCQFYRDERDLVDVVAPYLRAGLEANEYCMWVTSEPLPVDAAREALRAAMPDLDVRVASGQLELLSYDQWYFDHGAFEFERVFACWASRLEHALSLGYDGMRVTGNTAWLEQSHWDDFAQYESMLNRFVGGLRMMALCTYSLDRCSASEVIDVVGNHQFALVRRGDQWHAVENSERKRMAEALRLADEHREDLLRAATHDLRTPISVILSAAETIKRKPETGARRADTIIRNCRSMESMLSDLTEMVRLESGALKMERRAVSLPSVVAGLLDGVADVMDTERVRLHLEPDLPPIQVDPDHFERVLLNLLSNALKYSAPHTDVVLEATTEGDRVLITVSDRGEGIRPEDLPHLFDRFYRAETGRKAAGQGLGLYITRMIVEAHGGAIHAESEAGRGSRFVVSLPVAEPPAPHAVGLEAGVVLGL